MEASSWDIRRSALQKIAALSASSSGSQAFERGDLNRLCRACPKPSSKLAGAAVGRLRKATAASKVPMNVRELEVLLALCHAAPSVQNLDHAHKLLDRLSEYLPDLNAQAIAPSPYLKGIEPCPWEALTRSVTSAMLAISCNHPSLRETTTAKTSYFLEKVLRTARSIPSTREDADIDAFVEDDYALDIAALTTCLLGFLDAVASNVQFWTAAEMYQLIEQLRRILSEEFLVQIESAFSVIRNSYVVEGSTREWKQYAKHYAAIGRPLSAMLVQQGFMNLLVAVSISMVMPSAAHLEVSGVLDSLMRGNELPRPNITATTGASSILETLTDISTEQIGLLEDGADFLRLGSTMQQKLAFSVKASVLTAYLNCAIINEDIADVDILMFWLEDSMADPVQMADETLAMAVLKCMAVLSKLSPAFASNFSKALPAFVVEGRAQGKTMSTASRCLAHVLRVLSKDAIITTLYSLGNVLSSTAVQQVMDGGIKAEQTAKARHHFSRSAKAKQDSAVSLDLSSDEDSTVHGNVIEAIIGIAVICKDEKITALAQSMLIQKIGRVGQAVDARIIYEAAVLSAIGGQSEFKSLLRLYSKISHEAMVQQNKALGQAVKKAEELLSRSLDRHSHLHEIYLAFLLESIIGKGDIHESDNSKRADIELAAREIAELLSPLSILLTHDNLTERPLDDSWNASFRDAWFNIVVHGFTSSSSQGKAHMNELRQIAIQSQPLIAEQRSDQLESDIELSTTLRRGMHPENTSNQKRTLTALMPSRESDIRGLTYPEIIFVRAAYLMETLRAESGDCTKILEYFRDPNFKSGHLANCMTAVYEEVLNVYLRKTLSGTQAPFSALCVAEHLVQIFTGCCHRIERVQQISCQCADTIINNVPSALCQRSSLFALLELLTIMWSSCLDAETEEYEWKSSFSSSRGNVKVELSDNYRFRHVTLDNLYKRARAWVTRVMNIAPLDIKGLLQTYLSDFDDEGAYGHLSLGRSFAYQMGAATPATDQRLGAIERFGDHNIDAASDFVAQYTTRQEYRHADTLPSRDQQWLEFLRLSDKATGTSEGVQTAKDMETLLANLESRIVSRKFVSGGEIRDVLRRAAAFLCRSSKDQTSVVHDLVGIPFLVFTKQSIKLGISLWLGVINENPRMATRILTEVAESWKQTVRKKQGMFDARFDHVDPFYVKEEFAPSDRQLLAKRHQAALDLLGPHLRLLQFLSSHFNATRLGSLNVQRIFHGMMQITLDRLKHVASHPLAREVHFQAILFSLRILRHSTTIKESGLKRMKDQILSAGLRWFCSPPRWSYGGNRLQMKAETHLLADVVAAMQTVASIGIDSSSPNSTLRKKQDLLLMLLETEQTRLMVWLFPLDHDRREYFTSATAGKQPSDAALSAVLKTAWNESPSLAVQLCSRYQSARLRSEVRWLLINFPEKAVDEADALQYLLGSSLPSDVSFQLKYLLYWAPVNPISAVTYFLPAYGNHPFVLQYAMRALESHAVDVTFFYVPQIVQTLRYDALGYVERYIVETAKFSQLFAHQIIWNMTANAYKDEESKMPDPVKPVLDKVRDSLISSFSGADKDFYEREFSFFEEVTDISGKLRPFIKKTKPEKKQKIEEELRNIKVEVGVYLPSNPEGTVIGIDRKSGKPLQSHAKAPFMATFRIKKSLEAEDSQAMIETKPGGDGADTAEENHEFETDPSSVEVWQSAIFKVGDDCRQDVLALQMIAAFRGIFNHVGLDVYVYPYRVTATAPGCGVIDVLPNSISRDMLGREAVNGLYDYFVSKYGGEDSIRFQEARNNFVKSMAAYSVISYLLQFKDRHNGNIMVDDAGHILHIDFGFCFDIAPGGIKFERAPFKLTSEMVAVMGGTDASSQSFRWFEELCVKAFLACRPYTEKLIHIVLLMLDSGLPCFKPETIQHFRDRFVLERSDREAADFMRDLIRKSWGSYSTKGYDQFQLLTNGIPY